jgi:hypothetical protein
MWRPQPSAWMSAPVIRPSVSSMAVSIIDSVNPFTP